MTSKNKVGDILGKLSKFSTVILLTLVLLTYFHILISPFHIVLKITILFCLGIIFGIDNMTYTEDGETYGMIPIVGELKAIKKLSEELRISPSEVTKT